MSRTHRNVPDSIRANPLKRPKYTRQYRRQDGILSEVPEISKRNRIQSQIGNPPDGWNDIVISAYGEIWNPLSTPSGD